MAAAAILNRRILKISLAVCSRMAQTHHFTKFRQNWSFYCGDVAFFVFSRWPPPPSWIFKITKFYWLFGWQGSRCISMLYFVKIDQSVAKILWFFKMAASAILDCRIHKILLAVGVWRTRMHHFTKFRQNRSFRCRDILICQIFKMATAAILDFLNREILLVLGSRVWRRISMPNFVKIGQPVAKILRFFDFSRWRSPPFEFQDGGRRHLRFFKSRNFIGYWGSEGGYASVCRISSKSVNRLRRY